ncbi:hypothetical protein Bca101_014167 [Brassica carinata]
MDYDDNDFHNQNLNLAGEANSKFPQPYTLPKFDFDDSHLRFDSSVETEAFLGIESNQDSNWIEDFSRGSSGLVFSSVATASCAISRHTNVWSEATSSESVEMLLNSVGQDEVVVRENTVKKSETSVEPGCTMEQLEETGQTNREGIVLKEGTSNVQVQHSPSVDDSPGEIKRDSGQDQVLGKNDSPSVAEESSKEEKNAIPASNTSNIEDVDTIGPDKAETEATDSLLDHIVAKESAMEEENVEDLGTACHDMTGTETTDSLLDQTVAKESAMEETYAVSASNIATVEDENTAGHDMLGTETTDSLLDQTVAEESAMEEKNTVLNSNNATVEEKDTAGRDNLGTDTTDSLLDQTVAEELSVDEKNADLASVTANVENVNSVDHDKVGMEATDSVLDQTVAEDASMEEKIPVLASDTTNEAETSAGHDKIETETTDSLIDQTVGEESSMEENNAVSASNTATVEAVDPASHEMIGNETADSLIDQTVDETKTESRMEIDCSVGTVQTGSGDLNNQTTLLPETSSEENVISGHTSKADWKEMELSDVTVLERGDTALSDHEVGVLCVSGTQCQDVLVSSAHTTASERESTIQTETHTQILRVETSESKHVSQMDSIVKSTQGDMAKMGDNNEGIAVMTNLKQSMELAETVVSEFVEYASRDSASKLVESKSQSDTIPTDKSGTTIGGEECEASISQDEVPVSLTSSIDFHTVNISSDANEKVSFSETEKVSSGEPENSQTVPPIDVSSSGSHLDQQARKHTEDTQQSTQVVKVCTASEGSKDATDADAAGQVLLQQSEETILEEILVTEVVNVPETQSILDNSGMSEKPETSSLANLGSEAGEDGRVKAAAPGGIKPAGTPVSRPTGDAIEIGDSCASTSSEPFVKSHVTPVINASTNLGNPAISFPAVKTSELQLDKTKINNVKKSEDQNVSSSMSAESPVLNRNETLSSGLNLSSGPRKAGEISKVVNFSQATLVSPVVVGSPSSPSLEKTAAKSSRTKSERKPRRTPKSAGKETSRKGNSVKGATPFNYLQTGVKTNAVNQSSASSIQITQSTEKQQSLQTPALNSFWTTVSAPTASLPDLNSSALASILRRPFTDLQQVQLRAQIFVHGALMQGIAPDEAYMISAFGGPDGGKGSWEKAWRSCALRAQKMHISTPETPLQSRQGKTETLSVDHTSSKESSVIKPIIPLSSPLWNLSTPLDTLQSNSIQRGSTAGHQPLLSSSHAHQNPSLTNIVGQNTPWMSPLPYRNPWLASPQTSGLGGGSRFPVFPIPESAKLTPTKESPLPYSGGKHVPSGTSRSSNVFKGTTIPDPASTVVAPAQPSTGTKTRKRKKMPVSVESGPSILNSLNQTELVTSPHVSMSTSVPATADPGSLASNAGTLPNVASITAVPMNPASTFPAKKIKSSLPSPIFGGNLVPEVKQRSVLSVDTVDKLNEAKMHAEDASALATAAVTHSEYVWKQIDQQRHAGLQPETQERLALAAVAIAAAAAVAKAAAAAANVAANAALQVKLMAEEASLPSVSYQGNGLPRSKDVITQGQGTPASILKGEGAVVSSNLVLSAAREAAKKRIEAATAATKRAENMDSIVKAAELASEAVSQAGILVSMGHPPSLDTLVEAGPSNYWREAQESVEAQPRKVGVLEKETMATSDGDFASPRTVPTELDGCVRTADGLSGLVSATGRKTKGQTSHSGAELAKNSDVVLEPQVGSEFDTQIESEQIMKTTNDDGIKEGSLVEVFKEGPELKTAWYSANVLSLEDGKAYVLFNDLSVEQGTDKLKEWIALKAEGDEAPKIRTARSVTAMPYEGTRKRRRAAIGDPVWKIGDRVDSWVHDSWLEGVITEKNKNDDNTVTVHFPAQGDTLTIKAWNLRPSLVWKDGRWIECSTSGDNNTSSHEGDTPKEKRPRLGAPALVSEVGDTKMKTVDDADTTKPPQTGVLDLGVSENTFNIGTSTREENKPGPLRMKRTGLQTQGAKVIYGIPKPGKKRKFMDVSKHYVSEASTKTRERKEPTKPLKSIVPQNPGPGSWRMPSKTVSREKQTTIPKPRTFRPAPKAKEKPGAAARIIPRKESRSTTASNMEADAVDQSGENKGLVGEEQSFSQGQDTSSLGTNNKGKMAPTAGRLAMIEEDKAMADSSSKASDGMEPRRSVRRIQPTSRLLEGLQTSMMTSKIPSMSHSKSHQSKK